MDVEKPSLSSLLLLLLLLLVSSRKEASVRVAEARVRLCRYPSSGFRFLCFSDANCAQVCMSEGYTGGSCHGIRRRCMCQKRC